ncbi:MAG: tRNA (N(6)-L-threonylcarbamoyladenosine(37)-C(2))-methylthiotransferase MtaB, partial [Pseudomonadota bacterium]
ARKGTPAARMPQLPKAVRAERAARLRARGAEAVAAHLAALMGTRQPILMERPRLGRTPGFAEVVFDIDQPEGAIVDASIRGVDGTRLLADP